MTPEELQKLLKNQTIKLPNAGIDSFPGEFMLLDGDQIKIDGKIVEIRILAWFDYKLIKGGKCANNFIISHGCTFIILDHFFEAIAVWNYFLTTFPI